MKKAILLILTFFVFVSVVHGATTIYLSPSGTDVQGSGTQNQPFQTLQYALQTTQTTGNPDVIVNVVGSPFPPSGNSEIQLTYGSLTLQGTGSGANAIFDFSGTGTYFINATNSGLTLSSLEIRGGSAISGGLITVQQGKLVASNVNFHNASATNAGGLVVLTNSYGSVFTNCIFSNGWTREPASKGGHLALTNTDASFVGCTFSSGLSEQGGSVFISNSQSQSVAPSFTNCVFSNNLAQALETSRASGVSGGAVDVAALPLTQTVTFSNCTFDSNSAPSDAGGSIYVAQLAAISVTNSVFQNGQAAIGGAIYSEKGVISATNTLFTNLTAMHIADESSGKGGAIYLHAAFLILNNCQFTYNNAGENGGAIAHNGGSGHVTDPTAQDQTDITGCTFSNNIASISGGAIYVSALVANITITDTNFIHNKANALGEFVGGGAILVNNAPLSIQGLCSFENNTAFGSMGGAIYYEVAEGTPGPAVGRTIPTVSGAHFTNNFASVGGAICIDGLGPNESGLLVIGCRFAQNQAQTVNGGQGGQSLVGQGGAIMATNTSAIIVNTVFYDNFATANGGALYLSGKTYTFPHCFNCTFFGNLVGQESTETTGTNAYISGQTTAIFTAGNETEENGYLFVVSGANASLTLTASTSDVNAPCYFTGITVKNSGTIIFNCTPTIGDLLVNNGQITLPNSGSRLTVEDDVQWYGGGFNCPNHGFVSLKSSVTAVMTNGNPKWLNNCNFVNMGNSRFSNFGGGEAVDLQLMDQANIFNYGMLTFSGNVIFNNEGTTPLIFENQGIMSIELTLALTGRANIDMAFVGTKKSTNLGLYIHLVNQNATITPATALVENMMVTPVDLPQYTALAVDGSLNGYGALQVIFPEFFKGTWSNLISYKSYTSKFTVYRGQTPKNQQDPTNTQLVGHRLKPLYSATSLSVKIAKSQNNMTGGEVFGVIFGVLLVVALIAIGVWFFFFRNRRSAEYVSL